MRTGSGLIIVALAVGVFTLLAFNSCIASGQNCVSLSLQPVAYAFLIVAGVLLVAGLLALSLPKPRDAFSEDTYCPECGRKLEPHPEVDEWYCLHCGKSFRSSMDSGFFQRQDYG